MNFVSPERFVWLWIALPIIIFYLLKTRLRRQRVSTLMFWDQLFDEKRQRSLLQRLRHWLSLLLQLAFLLLVVFALVDPLWQGQQDARQQIVVVLDNSASMNAIEFNGRSRIEIAREHAAGVAEALRAGDEIALITAGSVVRVVVGMSDFGPAVRDAAEEVMPTDGPTQVEQAIQTARRLASDPERRKIVVISDLAFETASASGEQDDIRVIRVGQSLDNVAITRLQVRRSLVDPIGYAGLIEVENFGERPVDCRLTIELGDELVDVIPISLEPDEPFRHTISQASADGGVLVASIDVDDALVVDNVARAILPAREPIPVTLVAARPNLYLESVLNAIPLIELTTTDTVPQSSPANGLTVLYQTDAKTLPTGSVMVIGPVGDSEAWQLGEKVSEAIVAKQNAESPLLLHVHLMNLVMPDARSLQVPDEANIVLESANGGTLMASMIRPKGRLVVLSTDLDAGDLPLRIAFPVMMTNTVNWFLSSNGELQPALATGQVAEMTCTAGPQEDWAWVDTDGAVRQASVGEQVASIGPIDRVGIVSLGPRKAIAGERGEVDIVDKRVQQVAINLSNHQESNLRLASGVTSTQADSVGLGSYNVWFYLAALALALCATEWFLYQRRIVG
tara:strand:- start:190021 stop:191889 length:1869 start_codon:yes stop_codon:yes gene_type:complete